ncbi:MAG: sodium/proline symporter [Lentisphaeria bacterium]|nr:sodium/proline symporter [Victivallales bacterium]MBR6059492.1 sodium/proline symporter [Victivallales bacterium]MCR4573209.1 sodium/proline symporter [Lentisphaeria bacterium]
MNLEFYVFIIYLVCMVCIGVYFFFKDKDGSEKTYFLGNRKMGAWVAALSAGASDMSAWVLMGLPTAIYDKGLSEVWIAIGLGLGYAISWIVEAPRLRQFSIVAGDSITIPQYLANRFRSKSYALQVICAIVFLVAYTIYAASSIKACGTLFHKVIGIDTTSAMYLAAVIIVSYTFLGGFSAVCWTDFFQGMLMLGAMLLAPIFAATMIDKVTPEQAALPEHFWSMTANWKSIASGLGWGLGYFGMPHIIIRFMSLKSQKDLRKSSVIGITWTVIILVFAALIGIIGRTHLGLDQDIVEKELVFVNMVREIFPAVISGLLLSAVLAAAMSTADSQLLAASSAFTNDVYKPIIRKNQSTAPELLWNGRLIVLVVAAVALIIATNPNAGSIMNLVSNAWGVFGAAFGPAILLSLFWRRFNLAGAVVGIVVGAVVDCLYLAYCSKTGIYEIIPGFFTGLVAAVIATLVTPPPSEDVNKLFDDAVNYQDQQ